MLQNSHNTCNSSPIWSDETYFWRMYSTSGNLVELTTAPLFHFNDTMEKMVLNLGKVDVTPDQLSVLAKGLNFCSTPGEPDPSQYKLT